MFVKNLTFIFVSFFSLYSAFADVPQTIKDMELIAAGSFKRGCNQFGPEHGAPEQNVYLDAYWIDKYEVTNKKYESVFPEHNLRRSIYSDCDNCPVTKISW